MAEENQELVRRIYEEGIFDDHPDQLVPLLSPEVEYINPSEAVEGGVLRGIDAVLGAYESLAGTFESSRHELRELFGSGDVVVASLDFHARARRGGGELEISQEEAHTWTLRDGKVVRFEWGRDLVAALERAGLAE